MPFFFIWRRTDGSQKTEDGRPKLRATALSPESRRRFGNRRRKTETGDRSTKHEAQSTKHEKNLKS
ncbi:MAG: hypothetical protein EA393_00665 [Bacteroidetes bacterium]|nr:MAG: hypothetical protein EA393_00665 [Bacteroidota bacterium]